MSIEKLEELKDWVLPRTHQYYDTCRTYNTGSAEIYKILDLLIPILKDQSDEIANLRQELAKKEDVIEVNELKEVRNPYGC